MRCVVLLLLSLAGLAGLCAPALPPTPAWGHGPSTELASYQTSARREIYRLRIVNDEHGAIAGSRDEGKQWVPLGRVLAYTEQATSMGFTASQWAPQGSIAATAVNSLHVCTGHGATPDENYVFSICPKELMTEAGLKLQSFQSPVSSIFTDIPAGTSLFGGGWAPFTGNPVLLERGGALTPLPDRYTPRKGDVFVIRVLEPADLPASIIFENRFGGLITAVARDGSTRFIGQVLQPVVGVGRFYGSQYAEVGGLRASHCGVICISTSPRGKLGGFQILPKSHAMSPEMEAARTRTQWMVVGPLDALAPSWEGVAPLYRDYLRPCWVPGGESLVVDVRVHDGPWQPMPELGFVANAAVPLPEWANTALQQVTHLRITFPRSAVLPQL